MRNIYMSRLVLCMNSKRFTPPFHAPPILAALSLDGVFTEITTRPFSEVDKENKVKLTKRRRGWKFLNETLNYLVFRRKKTKRNGLDTRGTENWKWSN